MITLYDYELSGNCYKVRLMLAALGLSWRRHEVDFYPGREHKSDWFLEINPLGQLPVLDDDGFIVRDAQAILVYLAARYDTLGRWYPCGDPRTLATIAMWLGVAEGLTATVGAARLHLTMFHATDLAAAQRGGHQLLGTLDEALWFGEQSGSGWLGGDKHATIADIACFPYVMLSEEAGVSRLPYPALRRWTDRVRRLPGFVPMSGIFDVDPPVAAQGS